MIRRLPQSSFRPSPGYIAPRLVAAVGAVVGICITGIVGHLWLGADFGDLYLVAPMGASAVLLFSVPASPLAQPWPVIGGNVVSVLVGVTCAKLIADPVLAPGVAVGGAIAVMALMRCIHPPGGAVALTTVLAWPSIAEFGYGFAIGPVALNSACMLITAYLFHKVSGHSYPHRHPAVGGPAAKVLSPAQSRVGFTRQDIADALRQYGDELDVLPEDLEVLFHKVEARALQRHESGMTCGDIMQRTPVSTRPHTRIEAAARLLVKSGQRALPVVDEAGHVLGLVGDRELTAALISPPAGAGLLALVKPKPAQFVASAMVGSVRQFTPDTSILYAAQVLGKEDGATAVVCDTNGGLLGVVTRQDVLAAISRDAVEDMLRAG